MPSKASENATPRGRLTAQSGGVHALPRRDVDERRANAHGVLGVELVQEVVPIAPREVRSRGERALPMSRAQEHVGVKRGVDRLRSSCLGVDRAPAIELSDAAEERVLEARGRALGPFDPTLSTGPCSLERLEALSHPSNPLRLGIGGQVFLVFGTGVSQPASSLVCQPEQLFCLGCSGVLGLPEHFREEHGGAREVPRGHGLAALRHDAVAACRSSSRRLAQRDPESFQGRWLRHPEFEWALEVEEESRVTSGIEVDVNIDQGDEVARPPDQDLAFCELRGNVHGTLGAESNLKGFRRAGGSVREITEAPIEMDLDDCPALARRDLDAANDPHGGLGSGRAQRQECEQREERDAPTSTPPAPPAGF